MDLLNQSENVLALRVSNYNFAIREKSCPFSFKFEISVEEFDNGYTQITKIAENVAMFIREYIERKYYYYSAVRRSRSMTSEEKNRHDSCTQMFHVYSHVVSRLSEVYNMCVRFDIEEIDDYFDYLVNDVITREISEGQ